MKRFAHTLPLLAVLVTQSGCDAGSPTGMGALEPVLAKGSSAPWSTSLTDAGVRLNNPSAPDAIRYFFVRPQRSPSSGDEYSVHVRFDSKRGEAGAGLLYALNDDKTFYYAFVARGKEIAIFERSPGGFRAVTTTTPADGWDPTALNRLTIREDGDQAEFLVNGESLISMGNSKMGRGSVGIVALGQGDFFFTGFESPPQVERTGAPPANPPARRNDAGPIRTTPVGGPPARNARPGQNVPPRNEAIRRPTTNLFDRLGSPGTPPPRATSSRNAPSRTTSTQGGDGLRSGEALRLRKFKIMDPNGFAQPVTAFSMLAPADWTLDGGVRWNSHPAKQPFRVHFTLRSPDGKVAFEVFPSYRWTFTRDRFMEQANRRAGTPFGPAMGAQEIIQRYVIPTHRANARLVSAEPSPEAARAAYERAAAVFGPRLKDGSTRVNTDAGRGLLEYQAGGDVFEEWITSVVLGVTSLSMMNTEALAQGRSVPEPMHNYEAFGLSAFRAPKGQLKKHEKLFATMTASIRVNRGWEQAIAAHQRKMHQINMKGIRDRAAITRQTNEEIREMMSDSWEKQQASQDRIAAAFTRTIRGVEEYVDPTNHERIDLTHGYENAWSNGLGEYILSEQVDFDPNPHSSQNWQRLNRVP